MSSPDTTAKCCARVASGRDGWRPHYRPCSRQAVAERDGKPYCRQHDPVTREEKLNASHEKRAAEWEAKRVQDRLRDAAPDLLAALIQARGALLLDAMVDRDGKPYGTTSVALEVINAAISKANGTNNEQP